MVFCVKRACWLGKLMDKNDMANENALVASAKSGDEAAFASLAEKYHGFLSGYVSSLSVPEREKEDLMQEALIGLLRAVRSYDGVSSRFATYVAACVRNSVITSLRRYGKQSKEVPLDCAARAAAIAKQADPGTPELTLVDIETTNLLHDRIFSVLSKYERAVFEMYLAEIPYAVMAKKLNKNEKSIDNAVQRIKAKLKKLV